MAAPSESSDRPALRDVLREPMADLAFLDSVRNRMIGSQQQERRVPRETAAFLNDRFPRIAAQTIADADESLAGRLILPGTLGERYFVGNPPDWYANPVNDNEFLWLLN